MYKTTRRRALRFEQLSKRELLAVDLVALDEDANDTFETATIIRLGRPIQGVSIATANDVDMYRFDVHSTVIFLDIDNTATSALDSYLRLFDSAGNEIFNNDDAVGKVPEVSNKESFFQSDPYQPPVGTYYIGVSSAGNTAYSPVDGSNATGGTTSGGYVITLNDLGLYIVNSLGDEPDADPGDGVAETGNHTTSLRAALEEAKVSAAIIYYGFGVVTFDLPGVGPYVIKPQSALPTIRGDYVYGLSSSSSYGTIPLIEIDGSEAGDTSGLVFEGGRSVLTNIAVNNFQRNGIDVSSYGTQLENVFSGTDSTGLIAKPNGGNGVVVRKFGVSLQNVVASGNQLSGIVFENRSHDNQVVDSKIGVAANGVSALANGEHGIYVNGSGSNTFARNIVSANGLHGIFLKGPSAANNVIESNKIGVNRNQQPLGNQWDGIRMSGGAKGNTIGGARTRQANYIAANHYGMSILTGSTDNKVWGNYIGTNEDGKTLGNRSGGVLIGAANNQIGASGNFANVISRNLGDGVFIVGAEASGNLIRGNFIGTDEQGRALTNAGNGVRIQNANQNQIGERAASANRIAFNAMNGVAIEGTSKNNSTLSNAIYSNRQNGVRVENGSTGNRILLNSIYSNRYLGIDIGPVGYNVDDNGDADEGANRLQNAPLIVSVRKIGNDLQIQYRVRTLPAAATYPLLVEFFVDSNGEREGKTHLGFTSYTETQAAAGVRTLTLIGVAAAMIPGVTKVTGTATDAQGNTSEFAVSRLIA